MRRSSRWALLLAIGMATVASGFVPSTQSGQQQQQQQQQQPQQPQTASQPKQQNSNLPRPPGAPKPFVTTIDGDGGPPIGATNVGTPDTTTFNQIVLTDPLAVCNDGTQAAYYWAPGNGSSADLWVVYLEGAMFCWSENSCNDRYVSHEFYMSSKIWNSQMAQGGIFATDGSSAWGNANRVYVKYCSSDLWTGDVAASPATFNYHFRGSHIVQAVMNDLMQNQGLGKTAAKLLFGGCSAGAIGAMNNIEAVMQMLPSTVQIKGFLDGAGLLNIPAAAWVWSWELETLPTIMAEMLAIVNPQFPTYCEEKFPGELWKCLIGEYRMPLLTSVPYFVNVPQFDMFNLMYNTDNYQPVTPQQIQYVDLFQTGTLSLISTLPPGTGVFSPTCLVHCLSGQTPFANLEVDGTTLSSALATWYFNNQPVSVVSSCKGWNCINNCGINQMTGLPCNFPSQNCVPVQLQKDPTPQNWQEPPLLMPPWPTANPPPQAPGLIGEQQELVSIATNKLSSLAAIVKGTLQSPPPPPPQQQQQQSNGQGAPPPPPPPPPPPESSAQAAPVQQVESSTAAPAVAVSAVSSAASAPTDASDNGKEAAAPGSAGLVRGGSASAASPRYGWNPGWGVSIGLAVAALVAGCVIFFIRSGGASGGHSAGERVALLQKRGVGPTMQQEATAVATSVSIGPVEVRRRHDHEQGLRFGGSLQAQPFSTALSSQQL